jgi:hypothetical protein
MAEAQKLLCRVFALMECAACDVSVEWPKKTSAHRPLSMGQ